MRALRLLSPGRETLASLPTPSPRPGAILIRILTVYVQSNTVDILNASHLLYELPYPVIPGTNAIGRVAALSHVTTSFKEGDLVLLDSFIRARDGPWNVQILWGANAGITPASKEFLKGNWRDGCMAEYALAPLENVHLLDEMRLTGSTSNGGLGYSINELLYLVSCIIVYGGLKGINLQPGERIIVTPATGASSGAAVAVAHAMGTNVIAASRSASKLASLKASIPNSLGRRPIETVVMTDDTEKDIAALRAFGPVNAVIDMSPPAASGSQHIRSAVLALRAYCRVSLMGGRADESLPFPWLTVLASNLTIKGQFMYERKDVKELISLAESGLLIMGREAGHEVEEFPIERWETAVDFAAKNVGHGKMTCIVP
ncbi:alcohol dehydrogenase [Colletotrichum tropicale]|nr:alcohol dehydrogenase [Colletotrichum tropicale]